MDKYPQIRQSVPWFKCVFQQDKTLNSAVPLHRTQQSWAALWREKYSFLPESMIPVAVRLSLVGFEQ